MKKIRRKRTATQHDVIYRGKKRWVTYRLDVPYIYGGLTGRLSACLFVAISSPDHRDNAILKIFRLVFTNSSATRGFGDEDYRDVHRSKNHAEILKRLGYTLKRQR